MLVCPDCFSEPGLKSRIIAIRPSQPNQQCSYHPRKKGIPLTEILPIISEIIANTYAPSDFYHITGEYAGETLIDVVYELTGVDEHDVAVAIQDQLIETDDYWPPDGGEPFFSEEFGYIPVDEVHEEHSLRWDQFRENITYGRRFFSEDALEILSEIFDGIHLLRDSHRRSVVYPLDPEGESVSIFRARIANDYLIQQEIKRDPASELGPPPARRRQHGRMHPAGIQAFYGAFDIETCIAELRPPVGGTVIAARFTPTRPLVVLDTTRFDQRPQEINKFAKIYLKQIRLWNFMKQFMHEIALPHLPDTEHLEYIPTQAVAEYLVHLHKFRLGNTAQKTIDAIIFRSPQNPKGKNIAIFGDASSVEGSINTNTGSFHLFRSPSPEPGLRIVQESIEERRIGGVMHETFPYRHANSDDDLF